MKNIIINADDCGVSQYVDAEIEKCIKLGKITSTTILANGDDFDGAINLYKLYNKEISFGWHLNLDEGQALTRSQLLLDIGFFVEDNGIVILNGRSFGKYNFNSEERNEIKKELKAQWGKLMDNGIKITHVDSHHFYHTRPCMLRIAPSLFRELNINRCRNILNYGLTGINLAARALWSSYYKLNGFKLPGTFSFYGNYHKDSSKKTKQTIELMIHPGHSNKDYIDEYNLMLNADYKQLWPEAKLITYKDI